MGTPMETAFKLAQKFVPSAEIDDEIMQAIGAGESEGMDEQMWEQMNAGREMPDAQQFGQAAI